MTRKTKKVVRRTAPAVTTCLAYGEDFPTPINFNHRYSTPATRNAAYKMLTQVTPVAACFLPYEQMLEYPAPILELMVELADDFDNSVDNVAHDLQMVAEAVRLEVPLTAKRSSTRSRWRKAIATMTSRAMPKEDGQVPPQVVTLIDLDNAEYNLTDTAKSLRQCRESWQAGLTRLVKALDRRYEIERELYEEEKPRKSTKSRSR